MKPPKHLSPATRKWFGDVIGKYELDGDHLRVLQLACESWDLAQTARVAIAEEGIVITAKTGARKTHPATTILNAASDRFLKAVALLGLTSDEVLP